MILYLDTSALVKLFFHEAGSKTVVDLVGKADSVITSQLAYAESCSALARRKRDKRLTEEEFQTARKHLLVIGPQQEPFGFGRAGSAHTDSSRPRHS